MAFKNKSKGFLLSIIHNVESCKQIEQALCLSLN
jgi:hypothetical protein